MDANIYSILRFDRHDYGLSNMDAVVLCYIFWKFAYPILLKKKVRAIDKAQLTSEDWKVWARAHVRYLANLDKVKAVLDGKINFTKVFEPTNDKIKEIK
jgi:hypothetical protein